MKENEKKREKGKEKRKKRKKNDEKKRREEKRREKKKKKKKKKKEKKREKTSIVENWLREVEIHHSVSLLLYPFSLEKRNQAKRYLKGEDWTFYLFLPLENWEREKEKEEGGGGRKKKRGGKRKRMSCSLFFWKGLDNVRLYPHKIFSDLDKIKDL